MVTELTEKRVQELVDQLNEIDLLSLFTTEWSTKKEFASAAKITKQKLRELKRQINEQKKTIGSSFDGRSRSGKWEKDYNLVLFAPLDDLVSQLEISISKLEHAVQYNEVKPSTPEIGVVLTKGIAGWVIVSHQEAARIKKEVAGREIQRRLSDIKSEGQAIRQSIIDAQEELKDDSVLWNFSASLKYWIIGGLCIAGAVVTFSLDLTIALFLVVSGVVLCLIPFIEYQFDKTADANRRAGLEESIVMDRRRIQNAKQDYEAAMADLDRLKKQ